MVVLCYRAEELTRDYVGGMRAELEEAGIDYQLVLVANYVAGSGDRTPDIVRELAEGEPRLAVVAREKEGMMGWDLRSGLEAATGRHIAIIDGDGQMPSLDVVKVYELLRSGGYDLVKTYRAARDDGRWRAFISQAFNVVFRVLFPGRAFRDLNSKPKVMTREAYETMHLTSDDWFADAEIMLEVLRNGLSVYEIPTVFYAQEERTSFVHLTAIWEFVRNLAYYRFVRYRPGRKRLGGARD